jgi:hypothetical protein
VFTLLVWTIMLLSHNLPGHWSLSTQIPTTPSRCVLWAVEWDPDVSTKNEMHSLIVGIVLEQSARMGPPRHEILGICPSKLIWHFLSILLIYNSVTPDKNDTINITGKPLIVSIKVVGPMLNKFFLRLSPTCGHYSVLLQLNLRLRHIQLRHTVTEL